MAETIEQLKAHLDTLTPSVRAELAHYLLTTLDVSEEGAVEAWKVEVRRRVARIRAGQATGKPAEELFKELREQHS